MIPPAHMTPSQAAELLVQALPHMQRYDQEIVVIKYGGHAMGDAATAEDFAEDIVLLEQSGLKPVVCHGGGPQIAPHAGKARHQVRVQAGPARHRRGDRRGRRDGSGRLDQQADRRLHLARGRQGDRALRQGRQHGHRPQGDAHHRRSRFQDRAGARSRLRRRARQGRHLGARRGAQGRADPGPGAGLRRPPTARPTTSTPTPSPAPSRARSTPSACCC